MTVKSNVFNVLKDKPVVTNDHVRVNGNHLHVDRSSYNDSERYNHLNAISEKTWFWIMAIVSVVTILCVVMCCICCRKCSKRRRSSHVALSHSIELQENILHHKQTIMNLPYDGRFDFPMKGLKLGVRLNQGILAEVFKADATGIVIGETTTTVAVKRAIYPPKESNLKLLIKEVKLMMFIGKHLNIVNLLGVVRDNLSNREFCVVTEFCELGDLDSFLQKNRTFFINQIDKNDRNNSSIQSIHGLVTHAINSRNTISSQKSMPGKTNDSMMRFNEDFHTITTTDLVSWSFQVAQGMNHLSRRGILHCGLAARNILLCRNRLVKICDFRLSQWIQSEENYDFELKGPVPIKWFALESITQMTFNTSTDVWSFGVLMWELFSLIAMPYPDINAGLVRHLEEGFRLQRPMYATLGIYDIMLSCWRSLAARRPNFTQLTHELSKHIPVELKQRICDKITNYAETNTDTNTLQPVQLSENVQLFSIDTTNLDHDLNSAKNRGNQDAPQPPVRSAQLNNIYENLPQHPVPTKMKSERKHDGFF